MSSRSDLINVTQRTAAWHLTLIPSNWQLIPGPNLWCLTVSQTPKRAQNVQPGPCLSARLHVLVVRAVAVLRGFRLQLWVKMRVWSVKTQGCLCGQLDSWIYNINMQIQIPRYALCEQSWNILYSKIYFNQNISTRRSPPCKTTGDDLIWTSFKTILICFHSPIIARTDLFVPDWMP